MLYTVLFHYLLFIYIGFTRVLDQGSKENLSSTSQTINDAEYCYGTFLGGRKPEYVDVEMAVDLNKHGIDPPKLVFVDVKANIWVGDTIQWSDTSSHFMQLLSRKCHSSIPFSFGPHQNRTHQYFYNRMDLEVTIHTGNADRPIDKYTGTFDVRTRLGVKRLHGNFFSVLFVEFKDTSDVLTKSKPVATEDIKRSVTPDMFNKPCACLVCGHKTYMVDLKLIEPSSGVRPFSELYFQVESNDDFYSDSCAAWSCTCRAPNTHPLRKIYVSEKSKLLDVDVLLVPFQYPRDIDGLASSLPRQAIQLSAGVHKISDRRPEINKDDHLYLLPTEQQQYSCIDITRTTSKLATAVFYISPNEDITLEIREFTELTEEFGFIHNISDYRQNLDNCIPQGIQITIN